MVKISALYILVFAQKGFVNIRIFAKTTILPEVDLEENGIECCYRHVADMPSHVRTPPPLFLLVLMFMHSMHALILFFLVGFFCFFRFIHSCLRSYHRESNKGTL